MKNYIFLTIFLFFGIVSSCNKESLTEDLKGKWIRTDLNTDMITFFVIGNDDEWLELSRGYVLEEDGVSRPKRPFGPYQFRIEKDSIKLLWAASSSLEWHQYFFHFKNSEIEMGNFIDNTSPTITLQKVK